MTFGVVPAGFRLKTLRDVQSEIEDDQHAEISPTLDVSSVSPDGQRNGITARQVAAGWEVLGLVYDALDPQKAEDDQLVKICKLTGTVPQGATPTEVSTNCVLDAGTTLTPNVQFAAVAGQPNHLFTPIDAFTAPSNGTHVVKFHAVDAGPLVVNASTLTVIVTPLAGWQSITNALDGKTGQSADDNERLRERREAELAAAGSGSVAGIRADVLRLRDADGHEPIQTCRVYQNDADVTDADGLLPHSIEVIVTDSPTASNALIAQSIFNSAGGGINTMGNTSGTATDEQGVDYAVRFSRPVERPIWLIYQLETGPQYGGDPAFCATVAEALRQAHASGDDVLRAVCERVGWLPGVTNILSVKLGFAGPPTLSSDLAIAVREIAAFDSTRIARV